MESEIPTGVQVLYLRRNSDFLSHISQNSVITKAKGYIGFLIERLHEERTKQQVRKKDFDIAIIGLQGLDAGFVVNNIKAKKTLLWIRNDLHGCDPTGKVASNIRKYAEKIDYFPCVSQTAKQSFEDLFPALREKAVLIYNVLDTEEMLKLAAKPSCIDNKYADKLKILSVCRVSDKAKGIFRMLDVYEKLRNEGIFFYWILAGNGEDYQELQKRIMQKKLQDGFVLLGHQMNPFPLYRQCDMVAVLSYYEGLCGVINEAKVMGKPVIATEFSGIHEQIIDGDGGLIVKNSFDSIYQGMKSLLTDCNLRERLTNNHLSKQVMDDAYKLEILTGLIKD